MVYVLYRSSVYGMTGIGLAWSFFQIFEVTLMTNGLRPTLFAQVHDEP